MTDYPEQQDSLWGLTVPPTIWAVHFLLCYLSAAVWCSKIGDAAASLGGIRIAIAIFTLAALVGIAVAGVRGYRQHGRRFETTGHDFDSREGRHRFLGFSATLLAGLSFVATVFTAMPAMFIQTCR